MELRSVTGNGMIICIAENRIEEQIATKLLILSLQEFCPSIPIHLYCPNATSEFKEWLKQIPNICLETVGIKHEGWEVKVYALLDLLKKGYKDIWWLDSDILVTSNFFEKYKLTPDTLVITEEAQYGNRDDNGLRTLAWGFPLGRTFPHTLNTGVLRVTDKHLALIEKWQKLLETPEYISAQREEWYNKPLHLFGDQDVLTALLGSTEFSSIPVKVLHLGRDVIQYFGFSGYTVSERVGNLINGFPPFIHCQRWKPWLKVTMPSGSFKDRLQKVYLELSPYCVLVKKYEYKVNEPINWLHEDTKAAKFLKQLGFGNPSLTGLPIAFAIDVVRYSKQILKSFPKLLSKKP